MKQLLAAVALTALCACAAPPPKVTGLQGYRDRAALIGVTSRYDDAQFAGLWYVRAGFGPSQQGLSFRMTTGAAPVMRLGAQVCDAAGVCGEVAQDLPTRRLGQGRFSVRMPGGAPREVWVLWVDEGFRTAALGNPDGTFGWIVDRSLRGGEDRIRAAREILDFNGYKIDQLRSTE